jgi:hypothetical protein
MGGRCESYLTGVSWSSHGPLASSGVRRPKEETMGRIGVLMLALMFALMAPGMGFSGADSEAILREDEEGVVLMSDDDGGDDSASGSRSRDSLDTTRERSRSRDRSKDKTGERNRRDRSRSRDRSRDNTRDHSVGVTTND